MKKLWIVAAALWLGSATAGASAVQNGQTCFSPRQECDQLILAYLDQAQVSIDMAIFNLSLREIPEALKRAQQRGVKIRLIRDEEQSTFKTSKIPQLIRDGFTVRFGNQKGSMHNKFTLVDGIWVETGSYNYSYTASELNAENQIYLKDPQVVQNYQKEFERIWDSGHTP